MFLKWGSGGREMGWEGRNGARKGSNLLEEAENRLKGEGLVLLWG